jgi:hypothetical protein
MTRSAEGAAAANSSPEPSNIGSMSLEDADEQLK